MSLKATKGNQAAAWDQLAHFDGRKEAYINGCTGELSIGVLGIERKRDESRELHQRNAQLDLLEKMCRLQEESRTRERNERNRKARLSKSAAESSPRRGTEISRQLRADI